MKDVQCYYCHKFDHYARYCYFNKDSNGGDNLNYV